MWETTISLLSCFNLLLWSGATVAVDHGPSRPASFHFLSLSSPAISFATMWSTVRPWCPALNPATIPVYRPSSHFPLFVQFRVTGELEPVPLSTPWTGGQILHSSPGCCHLCSSNLDFNSRVVLECTFCFLTSFSHQAWTQVTCETFMLFICRGRIFLQIQAAFISFKLTCLPTLLWHGILEANCQSQRKQNSSRLLTFLAK